MDVRSPYDPIGIPTGPPPCFAYEIERARAGNALFCPWAAAGQPRAAGRPLLYEDAAQLLKLLLAHGLQTGRGYHDAIVLTANALFMAASLDASGADCGEYVLYRLQGMPRSGAQKTEAKLMAMIGTFYTNLRTACFPGNP